MSNADFAYSCPTTAASDPVVDLSTSLGSHPDDRYCEERGPSPAFRG